MTKSLQTSHPTLVQLAGLAMFLVTLAVPFYCYRFAIQPVFSAARTAIGVGEDVAGGAVRVAAGVM
jgi:hypothetical protein